MAVKYLAVLLLGWPLLAAADDITDAIAEGSKAYKQGQFAEAATQWEYAAQLARQKRGEGLLKLLPSAPSGWTEENAESAAAGAAMFGGATTASKRFSDGKDGEVNANLSTDSPMVMGFAQMASNPMFASQSGNKPVTIEGQRGFYQYDAESRSGELTIVAYGKHLIQVSGSSVSEETLKQFARAYNYAELAKQ